MKLQLSPSSEFVFIYPDHHKGGDPEIAFDIRVYRTARIESTPDVFRTINGFLETLARDDRIALYAIYQEAKDILLNAQNETTLDKHLFDVMRKIFQIVNMDRLQYYVEINSGIIIPSDIKSAMSEVDPGFQRDKTYIREEYIQHLTMSVATRFCLPIWGEYMEIIEPYVSSEGKEYRAYCLLRDSALVTYPAYQKLIRYAEASKTSAVDTAASTLSGVGRDKIPEWLAGMVMVRKLPVIDLYGTGGKGNAITAVFSYVSNHLLRLPKKFMEDARERKSERDTSEEKDQSLFETYRAKQPMSYGETSLHKVYLMGQSNTFDVVMPDGTRFNSATHPDTYRAAKNGLIQGAKILLADPTPEEQFDALYNACLDLDETVPPELLRHVLAVTDGLAQEEIGVHNRLLTQWMLFNIMPAIAIDVMNREVIVRAMILTQTVLHHWGFHHLALLATGIELPNLSNLTLGEKQAPLDSSHLERLEKIFPHAISGGGKQRTRQNNYGYIGVQYLAAILTRHKHAVRVPAFLTSKDVCVDKQGIMQTPPEITHDLVNFVERINL